MICTWRALSSNLIVNWAMYYLNLKQVLFNMANLTLVGIVTLVLGFASLSSPCSDY